MWPLRCVAAACLCAAAADAAVTVESFYVARAPAEVHHDFTVVLTEATGMAFPDGTTVTAVADPSSCEGTTPPTGIPASRGYRITDHDAGGWVAHFDTLAPTWAGATGGGWAMYLCVGPDPDTVVTDPDMAALGAPLAAASWDGSTYIADPNGIYVFQAHAMPHFTVLPATALASPDPAPSPPTSPQRGQYTLRLTVHHDADTAHMTVALTANAGDECKASNGFAATAAAKAAMASAHEWHKDFTTAAGEVFVCVSVDGEATFTRIPYRVSPEDQVSRAHTPAAHYTPVYSFPVFARVLPAAEASVETAHVTCGTLIAGHDTACTIAFYDASGSEVTSTPGIDAGKVEIALLTDGDGDVICPLPEVDSGLGFVYKPLKGGRAASIRLLYDGVPVPLKEGVSGWIENRQWNNPTPHPGVAVYDDTTLQRFWIDHPYAHSIAPVATAQATSAGEKEWLEDLYTATTGAEWFDVAGWHVGDPCSSSWVGVVCLLNRVVEVRLPRNNLAGAVPSLERLPHLRVLDLRGNRLTGAVSAWSDTVREIRLDHNQLTGADKAAAAFTTVKIGSCLQTFTAAHNGLTALPTNLFVSGHAFAPGVAPASRAVYPHLERVDVSWNALSGALLGDLDATKAPLREIKLAHNALTGALPLLSFPARPIPPTLQVLDLSHNGFTGAVPAAHGSLDALLLLELTKNDLSGALPAALRNVHRLPRLGVFVGDNRLSGLLPSWAVHVRRIDLRKNGFTCPLPTGLTRPLTMQGQRSVPDLDYCDLGAVP
eukprot:TRINITY_DN1832_c1_g9_i1.p1 TRINITY_DN1832_c1_g9~~TRINITY_DN1832_c1_g9_i1.p1  ORF type:complete len:772 (+),score=222.71 TRINITY_DN1832_c1_g9_i1:82-2397(+)